MWQHVVVASIIACLTAGCAPTPPPNYTPPVWTTPAWKAEQAVREQQSNELMKKWIGCETDKTRELALSDLPARVAVARAITSCHEAREDWVQRQVSPGVSREMAESVASGAEDNLVGMLRDYVLDIRAAHAAKKPNTAQ
jgi:hypothetical protein